MNKITEIAPPAYSRATTGNTLTKDQRERAREAAHAIDGAFTWDDTAEGGPFWYSVVNRLHAIAKGEPLS